MPSSSPITMTTMTTTTIDQNILAVSETENLAAAIPVEVDGPTAATVVTATKGCKLG